jgi:hypothetical protein
MTMPFKCFSLMTVYIPIGIGNEQIMSKANDMMTSRQITENAMRLIL